jgi:hypothetical protein
MTELLLRDSTDPFAIPLEGLAAAAGYGDGEFVWPSDGWARFAPPIVSLSIVVSADDVGDILDVETGDATPADVPRWVRAFARPGRRRPTIYASRDTWPKVVAALEAAGLSAAGVDWWAATLDGTTEVPGAVAVQARGSNLTGGHYDESVILDPSWVGLEGDMTSEEHNALMATLAASQQAQGWAQGAYAFLLRGVDDTPANGNVFDATSPGQHFSAGFKQITSALADIKTEVAQLQQPAVNAAALAAALAGDAAFLGAIADAVVKLEASKLGAQEAPPTPAA